MGAPGAIERRARAGAIPRFAAVHLARSATLLEGITVTGHRIADQEQILALNDAFTLVDELVGRGEFRMNKASSDQVHAKVAVHEAIESGHFPGEGHVDGGGLVSIGALGTYRASAPGENGATLKREFRDLIR